MDLESEAVGKNKLSEKTLPSVCSVRTLALCSMPVPCFRDHKHFTMNFYYHMVGTAKSRAHHSFASLEDTNSSVFQEASLVTQLSILCFEGFISQLRRQCSPILAGTSWRFMRKAAHTSKIPKGRMAYSHRRTLPMQDAPQPSISPNHMVEGIFQVPQPRLWHKTTLTARCGSSSGWSKGWRWAEILATDSHKSTKLRWRCEAKASGVYILG